jgi:hypothetical protein
VNIVQPPTLDAANVVVPLDISVESSLAAAEIELLDRPQPGEQFQIAIHGPKADLWQPAPHDLVKPGSGRVRCELLEFLKNHQPLPGTSLELEIGHNTFIATNYYYYI